LTKYFELDPDTKKIYRKDMLIEAFKSHTQKLISAKKDKISNLMETTLAPLKGILETLRL
jgi:hypothetical protein